ncbi:molybdopterin-dependent oxidoreductase [Halovivax limisalsi]|uniref:molybdopterin-dependent oxidoreductase n=1 Tax=Halovivax limisalsi TaxID=1453760 RepID=UPI001FFCFC05|nr:molybdopterin-dependent oxidoreductase [Halovivax limisalsi]
MAHTGTTPRQPDRPDRWRRATIGFLVGAAWLVGLATVAPLIGEFAVVALAQAVIRHAPGWVATTAIDALGFAAQPVLVGGVAAAILAATTLAGVTWPRVESVIDRSPLALANHRTTLSLAGCTLATGLLFIAAGAPVALRSFAALVLAVAAPFVAARILTDAPGPGNRRGFLRRAGGVAAVGLLSAGALRAVFDRLVSDATAERAGEALPSSVDPPTGDAAYDFDGMPSAVTHPTEHYVVDKNLSDPVVDVDSWTLDIDGAVEEPYSLSYDDLLTHEGRVEQTTTMCCISNPVGGDLVGTSHWVGVPLSELVAAAAPRGDAVDVVTHAVDGYSEAIPYDLVEREDVLIAYGMGDRTLTVEHGFPARLLVPGRYGMKMTKWVTRIELAAADHDAYWEKRGWSERAVVNTASYVRGAERRGTRVVIGGVAFGGLETGVEEIATVEVSVTGGDRWHEAELEAPIAPHAWRRWRYAFDAPDRSTFDIVVRAITRDGTVQTSQERDATPDGSTGWHRRQLEV